VRSKRQNLSSMLVLAFLLVVTACQAKTVFVEKEVTRVVEKEIKVTEIVEREVTKIVTRRATLQVEVTPTVTPIPAGGFLNLVSPGDADSLNPLLSRSALSDDVQRLIFATPFATDPWTGETLPSLIERWEFADQNQTVLFHVHEGALWSDGQPVTARDYKFTYDALMAVDDEGQPVLAGSPYLDLVGGVESVQLLDDYTLQVTFARPSCDTFDRLSLPWLPAHVFLSDPGFAFADLLDHPFNLAPTVFSGPFMLKEWIRDDHITLVGNPDYWQGAPHLDGILFKVVADEATQRAMLRTGETDLLVDLDPKYLAEMEQVEHLALYRLLRNSYDFIGLQQGDPGDPQARLDEDGAARQEHGMHPILGSKQVRQALAYAIDTTAIINKARMGQGAPLHVHTLPIYGWAYNSDLEPRPYDPQRAAQLLDEAGWVLNEETGFRACQGCGTTEDGTPMRLSLKTNQTQVRENVGLLVQGQLEAIGVEVIFETLEWSAYLDMLLGQSFDMVIGGIKNAGPAGKELFLAEHDVPYRGFNFCSFYSPEYEALVPQTEMVVECASEERGEIYRRIQEVLYDEQPYIWLYAPRTIVAVNTRIGNVNPGPWSTFHNIHTWYIRGD
jgi:peptide/nickel transport system substrate-binding protein